MLSGILSNTSLIHSPYYSKRTGGEVYIKPENMQVTGAYKVRGACYKVSTLTEEEKAKGLVTASAATMPRAWPLRPSGPESRPPL